MSNFKILESLERDRKQSGLYDFFITSFVNNKSVYIYAYKVQRGESSRIDKICKSIYKNIEHMSFLLNLNNVLNPLTIKTGDLILYVQEDEIGKFNPSSEENSRLRDRILNKVISDKKQKIDKSRKEYVQKRKSVDPLPPNIKQTAVSPLTLSEDGIIKIIIDKEVSQRSKNSK